MKSECALIRADDERIIRLECNLGITAPKWSLIIRKFANVCRSDVTRLFYLIRAACVNAYWRRRNMCVVFFSDALCIIQQHGSKTQCDEPFK